MVCLAIWLIGCFVKGSSFYKMIANCCNIKIGFFGSNILKWKWINQEVTWTNEGKKVNNHED